MYKCNHFKEEKEPRSILIRFLLSFSLGSGSGSGSGRAFLSFVLCSISICNLISIKIVLISVIYLCLAKCVCFCLLFKEVLRSSKRSIGYELRFIKQRLLIRILHSLSLVWTCKKKKKKRGCRRCVSLLELQSLNCFTYVISTCSRWTHGLKQLASTIRDQS
jgi:hypothetical protein